MSYLLTRIRVYTVSAESPVDFPEFKYANSYDIHLCDDDFLSLQRLKEQIKTKTKAGFLASQFFRVGFKASFDEASRFMVTDADVTEEFKKHGHQIIDLAIVRYSKVQAYQLKYSMTPNEQTELDHIFRQKRSYAKVPDDETEKEQNDSIIRYFVSKKGGSYKHLASYIHEKSSQAQYYSKEMVDQWAAMISKGQWNSIILPPLGFPVVKEEDNDESAYVSVSVDARHVGLANLVAGLLNSQAY